MFKSSLLTADQSGSLPAAGAGALVILVLVSLFLLFRTYLASCARLWKPQLGARLMGYVGIPPDYTSLLRRLIPLLLVGGSLTFKFIAIGLDQWAKIIIDNGDFLPKSTGYCGVFQLREDDPGMPTQTMSYKEYCEDMEQLPTVDSVRVSMCKTARAAGVFTFACTLLSILVSVLLALIILYILIRRDRLVAHAQGMWRWASLSETFTWAAFTYALALYLVFHHWSGDLNLGSSWYLMIFAFPLDLALAIFYRRAVAFTPPPNPQQDGSMPVLAPYQQLGDNQRQQQQYPYQQQQPNPYTGYQQA